MERAVAGCAARWGRLAALQLLDTVGCSGALQDRLFLCKLALAAVEAGSLPVTEWVVRRRNTLQRLAGRSDKGTGLEAWTGSAAAVDVEAGELERLPEVVRAHCMLRAVAGYVRSHMESESARRSAGRGSTGGAGPGGSSTSNGGGGATSSSAMGITALLELLDWLYDRGGVLAADVFRHALRSPAGAAGTLPLLEWLVAHGSAREGGAAAAGSGTSSRCSGRGGPSDAARGAAGAAAGGGGGGAKGCGVVAGEEVVAAAEAGCAAVLEWVVARGRARMVSGGFCVACACLVRLCHASLAHADVRPCRLARLQYLALLYIKCQETHMRLPYMVFHAQSWSVCLSSVGPNALSCTPRSRHSSGRTLNRWRPATWPPCGCCGACVCRGARAPRPSRPQSAAGELAGRGRRLPSMKGVLIELERKGRKEDCAQGLLDQHRGFPWCLYGTVFGAVAGGGGELGHSVVW